MTSLESLWKQAERHRQVGLLKLAILREQLHQIHAQKSQKMAVGAPADAHALHQLETKIEALKTCNLRGVTWEQIVDPKPIPAPLLHREIPAETLQTLGKDKLDRFDRKWEYQLTAEAISQNWSIWTLDAWVFIATAEESHKELNDIFWPNGLVLFVEGAPRDSHAPLRPRWKGRWFFALSPDVDPQSLDFTKIAGSSLDPEPPVWSLLHAAR
jgi:hypothetical protein